MEKVGIFYGSMSGNTRVIAELIKSKLPENKADIYDIFESKHNIINKYDNLIFGVPTWRKMDLHEDWRIFLDNIACFNLNKKIVAIYGLGDQFMFSNAFADAIGLIYYRLKNKGCKFIGQWPVDGYMFNKSNATINNHFIGLVIDEDNQSELTEERVDKWIEEIIPNFK